MQVEVCVDSLEGAAAAAAGGADRIEVCSALAAGGLTPSVGLLTGVAAASASAATRAGRPAPGLFVMLRHRAGDFCYDGPDLETMVADVRGCLAACPHVSGFVFGALTPEGDVDEPATRAVVAAASPLPVTFHRAIDWTRDAVLAVEAAARCGCRTILSSGQAASCADEKGLRTLQAMVAAAGSRIEIMAGGGLNAGNAAEVAQRTGVSKVHLSGKRWFAGRMRWRPAVPPSMGSAQGDEFGFNVADEDSVRRVVQALRKATPKL
eukprot:TRINITY_DN16154_c0_g1_i2.p1 TRINITY_DN16154_c0_g1~~TRINITY_DN16154_c0_g1_i2.p1  ORF type:complete len:284 (+),score=74.26 TRINITY_DN16154_c0_g1_i2:60-854(+)